MHPNQALGTTDALCERARLLGYEALSETSREVAKQCLLDWLGLAIAARCEPVVEVLAKEAAAEGGAPLVSLIGRKARANMRQATLINGAMGHALDYDDATITMGHPTVPVAPVILAVGERDARTGADLLTAFIAGVETEIAVSRFAGPSHYARGFHGTATYGCFGAAAAAAHLLKLDASQFRHAMGIAGTHAAGLKAVFGTMCKPLHAGNAATIGLLAAERAGRGFTSSQAILETPWGFGATQSDEVDPDAGPPRPAGVFDIPNTLFKYHAACYLTHASIEACMALRKVHAPLPAEIKCITVGVDPGHLSACAIAHPTTGLESKFSLAHTAALALSGENSADIAIFSDANAVRPELVDLRSRVEIRPRVTASFLMSDVTIELTDGSIFRAEADTALPARDLDLQWRRLSDKFRATAGPYLGPSASKQVIDICRRFEQQKNLATLMALVA